MVSPEINTSDFLISAPKAEIPVAMAMTDASFRQAHEAGITRIEVNPELLGAIAAKFAERDRGFSSLTLVTRGKGDEILPEYRDTKFTDRFFPAGHLNPNVRPQVVNLEKVTGVAKELGCTMLTGLSVEDWGNGSDITTLFKASLTGYQRPLELPDKPGFFGRIKDIAMPPRNTADLVGLLGLQQLGFKQSDILTLHRG